ncbi:prolyl oligopeptidase family serine peptidase [Asanoa sp. WMMD1127]|uniref:alpha/beta hydrolase family protein n=1 Tax=Asanoa sp. WMMD1127 TaxID=3016107 RepID=UPI00241648BC|nr:prolyl oligopeptidase family serine peptidase [Asanoa sp. WMMD1127]MDG4826805.1 prolyl oligopeptidase family serine peptidase [Asanoa sp. WMMD1127]
MTPVQHDTAAGVPITVLAPQDPSRPAALVVAWHLLDEPADPARMAALLPLAGLDAWRVYLGLPLTGDRTPPGGPDFSDVVANVFEPIVRLAAEEFPAVLAELRSRLPVDDRLALVGGSIGALVAQQVLAAGAPARATALISPVVQLSGLVTANERAFGMAYPWSASSTAMAERFDFVARADELSTPVLLVVGEEDDEPGLRVPAEKLWQALPAGRASLVHVPGMGHTPVTHAAEVDAAVTGWLARHLT